MRMAYCWTLDPRRQKLHAIIARLSLRDRSKYFVLEVKVHAYAHAGAVSTSLAAKQLWQLVELRLAKGEPEDVLPELPITQRRLVSSDWRFALSLQALQLQQLQWRPLMQAT